MRALGDHETEQSRMVDELADLDARGIARHLQHITDDVKGDVRSGEVDHLAIYADELIAMDRVLEGIYAR